MNIPKLFQQSAFVIAFAILNLQMGCKPASNSSAEATDSDQHSLLQVELDRLRGLPLEWDPNRRPLFLSEPAPTPKAWTILALDRGYRASGHTNIVWDDRVRAAFEAYSEYTRVNRTNSFPLRLALRELNDTGCDDPMIGYMRVRYSNRSITDEQRALDFLRAHEAIVKSEHHPFFKFMAGVRAVQSARDVEPRSKRGGRSGPTAINLQDLARDTNAPVEIVFEAARMWVEHSSSKGWMRSISEVIMPLLQENWGNSHYWYDTLARAEIGNAWASRGGGYVDTVDSAGWKGFREHLDSAEKALTKSWELNPDSPQTCYLMMKVELGQGRGRSRMESWFNRAMNLDTNFYDAAVLMGFYLEPRWHGSDKEALAFARSCVDSKQWAGRVPLVLRDLHHSLADYHGLDESPQYWHRPEVWRDIQSSYDRFFECNPTAHGWRHNYASDAYLCGAYSAFLEQTRLFGSQTNYAYFGGVEEFNRMVQRASDKTPSH